MSLFTAIQGMGAGGFDNPYIQQLQQKLQTAKSTPTEINKVHGAKEFREVLDTRRTEATTRPTFSQMVERGVDHVDAKQKYAANQVRMLMTGESDNLHHAMISMEESGVAFNLMLETRNKLMESYQELMRLRV